MTFESTERLRIIYHGPEGDDRSAVYRFVTRDEARDEPVRVETYHVNLPVGLDLRTKEGRENANEAARRQYRSWHKQGEFPDEVPTGFLKRKPQS